MVTLESETQRPFVHLDHLYLVSLLGGFLSSIVFLIAVEIAAGISDIPLWLSILLLPMPGLIWGVCFSLVCKQTFRQGLFLSFAGFVSCLVAIQLFLHGLRGMNELVMILGGVSGIVTLFVLLRFRSDFYFPGLSSPLFFLLVFSSSVFFPLCPIIQVFIAFPVWQLILSRFIADGFTFDLRKKVPESNF
jgi:hypothetical protein